jgi:2,3-bisphosphoglycerate-independent phosphoglycerate mutase
MTAARARPLVLVVLDGVGERTDRANNAVRSAKTPTLEALSTSPRTRLAASGPDVGLPKGRAGGSAIGHRNLGAGRIPTTDFTRIEEAVSRHALGANPRVADVVRIARHHFGARLHLFGLVSDARVESSVGHLLALIDAAHAEEVPVVVHAFLDGIDVPARSAVGVLHRIEAHLAEGNKGVIGTLSGRSYAMDREDRWDRVHLAYNAIVRGPAPQAGSTSDAIMLAYDRVKSDDLVEPVRIGDYDGMKGSFMCDFASDDNAWRWYGEENALAFGFRTEGLDKLLRMLLRQGVPPEVERDMLTDRGKPLIAFDKSVLATLGEHGPALGLPSAFERETTPGTLAEVLAGAGLSQLRCAESDARDAVASAWSGGREEPLAGEEIAIVPSPPRVSGKDPAPGAAVAEVARRAAEAIGRGKHDFILVHLASADLAARTGKLDLATRAVEAADAALGTILEAVRAASGALLVTSSHGNAEQMKDEHGQVHATPTLSRVPLYYLNDADRGATLRDGGRLADVAPTVLDLLGLPKPEAMTGRSLLER